MTEGTEVIKDRGKGKRQKNIMDKVCKDIVTGEKRQNDKKTKLGILYW